MSKASLFAHTNALVHTVYMTFILKTIRFCYQNAAKPILFRFDPEEVHDGTATLAKWTAKHKPLRLITKSLFVYKNEILEQTVDGVRYKNPIGLSGGFDKEAELTDFMPLLGLGFMEVGSITKNPYAGNEGIRLWRLKKSKSILVNYGLKNSGADVAYKKLKNKKFEIPVGINIAKTNSLETCDDLMGIEDYAYTYKKFAHTGSFITVNISCPNTFGGQPFHDSKRLEALLKRLNNIETKMPVHLKLSPDITKKERVKIAKLSFKYKVDGFICSNLTKDRVNAAIIDEVPSDLGGMSGKVVDKLTDELITDMYSLTNGDKTIIASGGVFTAEDAYRKIKLGASLIEMITGLIYEGPQVVSTINRGLVKLLETDGYKNVSEAVGVETPIAKS